MQKNMERINKIRELAAEGLSQSLIADHMGVTRERIRQLCDREGIETAPGLRNVDMIEAVRECAEKGMNYADTAKHLGVTLSSVRGYAARYGIAFSPTPRKWHRVKELAAQGLTTRAIADNLGISYLSVWRAAKAHGIQLQVRAISFYTALPVVIDGVEYPSQSAAARAYGVTASAVSLWVKTGKAKRSAAK